MLGIVLFFFATAALLLQSVCFAWLPLNPYVPWIAFVTLRHHHSRELWKALWLCACGGFIVDLLSSHPFGLHGMVYCITCMALFRQRSQFSYTNPIHFMCFCILSSMILSAAYLFFLFLFDENVSFHFGWVIVDLCVRLFVNTAYALLFFSLPIFLGAKAKKLCLVFHSRTIFFKKIIKG